MRDDTGDLIETDMNVRAAPTTGSSSLVDQAR
jgi:hypothetical protein